MYILNDGHSSWDAEMYLLSASSLFSCCASICIRTVGGSLVFVDATSSVQVKPCLVNLYGIIRLAFCACPCVGEEVCILGLLMS